MLHLSIDPKKSRPWKGITWHCSATPDQASRDWPNIVRYHMSFRVDYTPVSEIEFNRQLKAHDGKVFQRPWKDVAYHGGTELVNGAPMFHWGRPLTMIGAHAGVSGVSNKFNEDYLGLCCVGDYDLISPDPKLWEFNLAVTRFFMAAFQISKENVIGHCEVFDRLKIPRAKTCPGKCFSMQLLRQAA